jgi:peptidyl-tRNA hydrolase, PTH1 family
MRYLIVGLGNPGLEYAATRHNIGWRVLDRMAGETPWSTTRHGWRAEVKYRSRVYILIKPDTYMNLSGKAVAYHLQAEKVDKDRLVVVVDDLALPFGTLRLKTSGSDAGHNGLKDIQATLGNDKYPRLRVGIGAEFSKGKQVDYVLSPFTAEEEAQMDMIITPATQCVFDYGFIGPGPTMTKYNRHYLEGESKP